jgi:Activator of Hsp90 ATPase homolog 1-like protein
MTAPLLISFDVDCPVEHAFNVWTSKIGTWWPRDHTVSGDPAEIILESGPGGRIYERTSSGEWHEWGEVTAWDPPRRLSYLWHIGRERMTATEVEIAFVDMGAARTRIEIEHRGWDTVGEEAEAWRDQNRSGWDALVPHFVAAVGKRAD